MEKYTSPYEARRVSKQKYGEKKENSRGPSFNKFRSDGTFDRFTLSTKKQEIKREGGKQNNDTRKQVEDHKKYPYIYYGKVKATYQKEKPKNYQPIIENHKIKQDQQYKESYIYGTAAFIGQRLMVTAAHVVPEQINEKRLVKIRVYFQYSKAALKVESVLIHEQYQYQKQNSVSPFDMAVLVMEPNTSIPFPKNFLSIQWDFSPRDQQQQNQNPIDSDTKLVFLTFKGKTEENLKLMKAEHGGIELRNQCIILYKNTTMEGDSGSPILIWKSSEKVYKIVGIHIGDYGKANFGLLFTSKARSPKDIFSQMIEKNICLYPSQTLQKRNNSSLLKSTVEQNINQQTIDDQIKRQLQVNKNYSQSTEKQIQFLKQDNRNKELLIKNLKLINEDLRCTNQNLKKKNRNSYLPQIQKKKQLPQRRMKQDKNKTSKKIANNQINQRKLNKKQSADNIATLRKESCTINAQQSKSVSIQDSIQRSKKKHPEQQNCIAEMCKVFRHWLYNRRRTIANEEQPSSSTLQN